MTAIKGSAIESLVHDVNQLVEDGRIPREQLEARLESSDLELLEVKLQAASWYPLDSYGRLSDLLLEVEGGGNPEYLVERGRAAAARLRSTGIYSQLSADRERWGNSLGAMMASIGPAMFKGSQWHYVAGEEGEVFRLRVDVNDDFPEAGRHAAQGFIDYLAQGNRDDSVEILSRRLAKNMLEFIARRC